MKDLIYKLLKIKRKICDVDGVICLKGKYLVLTRKGIFKLRKYHIDFIREP